MKTIFLSVLFTISVFSLVAQTKDEQQIATSVEKLKEAMLAGDSSALVKLTDAKLTYGHSSGKIENRDEFVAALASGSSDFKEIELADQSIYLVGNTAIVRHKLTGQVVENGTQNPVKLAVMLVWSKAGKEWKLVARQAIKITS